MAQKAQSVSVSVMAGDGSNQKGGEIGAGYVNVCKKRTRQQRKVGHDPEEEWSSVNRPELAAFEMALRSTPASVTKPVLYLCNNQALLKDVKSWVSTGGKATFVEALDANILWSAIEELRKRTSAGSATLVKMKAHRGKTTNEEANMQAHKAISSKDVSTDATGQIEQSSRGKSLTGKKVP